jgi:hypothetical protein
MPGVIAGRGAVSSFGRFDEYPVERRDAGGEIRGFRTHLAEKRGPVDAGGRKYSENEPIN